MAFELYGTLAGNVSPMTGENVKPAYGGDEEAFLMKVVTPIYKVIENACQLHKSSFDILHTSISLISLKKLIK
jgi:callose synthase